MERIPPITCWSGSRPSGERLGSSPTSATGPTKSPHTLSRGNFARSITITDIPSRARTARRGGASRTTTGDYHVGIVIGCNSYHERYGIFRDSGFSVGKLCRIEFSSPADIK